MERSPRGGEKAAAKKEEGEVKRRGLSRVHAEKKRELERAHRSFTRRKENKKLYLCQSQRKGEKIRGKGRGKRKLREGYSF